MAWSSKTKPTPANIRKRIDAAVEALRPFAHDEEGLTMNPEQMADQLPLDTITLYRRLADGLSDMIEGDRLTESAIPDDYRWLADQLAAIAAADPGDTELPAHMRADGDA